MPDHRALSGRMLDNEVVKVEARTKERIKGIVADSQCAGAMRTSVVMAMIQSNIAVPFLQVITGVPQDGPGQSVNFEFYYHNLTH